MQGARELLSVNMEAGLVDAWQYLGAGLAGFGTGLIIDRYGWGAWVVVLIGFAAAASLLMLRIWNRRPDGAARKAS